MKIRKDLLKYYTQKLAFLKQLAAINESIVELVKQDKLKHILHQKKGWTTDEVHDLIIREFGVDYSLKQVRVILKKFGMNYAKPYPHDYRRPDDAEDILKKNCRY